MSKTSIPPKLNVEKTNQSDNMASYLHLAFTIGKDGKLSTKLYDKRYDFDFHIVNLPFLLRYIPSIYGKWLLYNLRK